MGQADLRQANLQKTNSKQVELQKSNLPTEPKGDGFSSGLAVFFATLGSAVGLGNIWRFPYLTGNNGGGTFILTYLIFVILIGIPALVCECFLGRKTRKNAFGTIRELSSPKSSWKYLGITSVLAAFCLETFYTCVAGWAYCYTFKALKGDFIGATQGSLVTIFENTVNNPIQPLLWQAIVLCIVATVIMFGVRNGIEKITKTLMPVLFVLIIICDIRSLLLPGAFQGLSFLFSIDISKITAAMLLAALGLATFKLSIGMGAMITYGSYFTSDNNIIKNSVKVALSDMLVSILACIAIFPAVFTFGMQPSMGTGLLFQTIPLVFSQIPFGSLLIAAFFLLGSIAATTAAISAVEVPVSYLIQEKGLSRKKAVWLCAMTIFVLGSLATLSFGDKSILHGLTIFGHTFYYLYDDLFSIILTPINSLFIAIFVGYFIKKEVIEKELSNNYSIKVGAMIKGFYFLVKYVVPILLVVVFVNSIIDKLNN